MEFNINEHVRVKLTDRGRKILRENHARILGELATKHLYTEPKEDANGWSEWQMWVLMRELGSACGMGFDPPFETTIEIPAALLAGEAS